MGLKAPGILVFLLSVIVTVVVLIAKLFGAIPYLDSATTQFYALLGAQILLILGCMMRGL